jgi:ribonuclease III
LNVSLLWTSLTHKSYSSDHGNKITHYERMEFLGDSVLGFFIADQLYQNYSHINEDTLTLYKVAMVREEWLAEACKKIGLDNFMILGNGEEKKLWRQNTTILADVMESFIAYIYLQHGLEETKKFVTTYIFKDDIEKDQLYHKSYKSLLQELTQSEYKVLPKYEDTEEEKDLKKNYVLYKTSVFINEEIIWIGLGKNKKTSQEEAAKKAYEKIIQKKSSDL